MNSIGEATHAVSRIDTLDRRQVRACFEARFTVERMASDYISLYSRLIGTRPSQSEDIRRRAFRPSGAGPSH